MTFILGTLLCVHLVLQHKLKKYFEPFSNESSSLSITLCLISLSVLPSSGSKGETLHPRAEEALWMRFETS